MIEKMISKKKVVEILLVPIVVKNVSGLKKLNLLKV